MRFDPDLMRKFLLMVEEKPSGDEMTGRLPVEGFDQNDVNEHIQLMIDDGFINGISRKNSRGLPEVFSIRGLTMKGHEFLAHARNNTVWKKVMTESKEKGMSLGATLLDKALQKAAEKYLGLGEA